MLLLACRVIGPMRVAGVEKAAGSIVKRDELVRGQEPAIGTGKMLSARRDFLWRIECHRIKVRIQLADVLKDFFRTPVRGEGPVRGGLGLFIGREGREGDELQYFS